MSGLHKAEVKRGQMTRNEGGHGTHEFEWLASMRMQTQLAKKKDGPGEELTPAIAHAKQSKAKQARLVMENKVEN